MYNIIPLIFILLALSIIIVIVIRKFSALATLDVENIPAEKEAKIKEKIISNRIKRNVIKWNSKLIKIFKKISEKISFISKLAYNKLHELKDDYKNEVILSAGNKIKKIEALFNESEELFNKGELEKAEKLLIDIIGIDSKNLKSFELLGNIYLKNRNYEEAEQTFKHILKLMEKSEDLSEIAEIYFNISLVNQASESLEKALENIKNSLNIEPNNPRYLDSALELSIINKDKEFAFNTYEILAKVNPENHKLEDFKKQIDEL